MNQPSAPITPTPLRPGGWRVLAKPGDARFMLHRTGSQPLRLRLLGQRRLAPEHIRALQALAAPASASRVRPGAALFVPRSWRGGRNTGPDLRYFSLRLAKAPVLDVELLGGGTLKGSGLLETLRKRIVQRSAEPMAQVLANPNKETP